MHALRATRATKVFLLRTQVDNFWMRFELSVSGEQLFFAAALPAAFLRLRSAALRRQEATEQGTVVSSHSNNSELSESVARGDSAESPPVASHSKNAPKGTVTEVFRNGKASSTQAETFSCRYMDELIRLGCAPELLSMKLFPDCKEITESMAMFEAVRQLKGFEREGEEVDGIVCVGNFCIPNEGVERI